MFHQVNKQSFLILISYIALIVWFTPSSLSAPFFISEEGTVYFKFAYEHEWYKALFSPHLGYYSLFTNVATVLAANVVPIEYAPFITAYLSLMLLVMIGTLVVLPNTSFHTWQQRSLILLAILFIPPAHIKLVTHLGHFYFAIATLLILVSNTEYPTFNRLNRFILGCAGLTGSVSIFLLPSFWILFFIQRDKERFIQACILSVTALLQIAVFYFDLSVVYPEGYRISRFSHFEPDVFIFTIFNRFVVANLAGYEIMITIGLWLKDVLVDKGFLYYSLLFGCVTSLSCLFILILKNSKNQFYSILIFIAFCVVSILGYISSTDGGFQPNTKIYLLYDAHRYFYIPNIILFLLLVISFSDKKWYYPLLTLFIAVNIYSNFSYFIKRHASITSGNDWKTEVSIWKQNPAYRLKARPKEAWFQLQPRTL